MNTTTHNFLKCLILVTLLGAQSHAQMGTTVKRFVQTRPAPITDSGFGSVIAAIGTVVAAGDPCATATVNGFAVLQRGTVRLFSSSSGGLTRLIEPPLADAANSLFRFGSTLAVFGNALAVGAPQSPSVSSPVTASVYWFNLANGRLIAKIPGANAGFGSSVAMHGDHLVVGSPREDSGRGAAYVYSISTQALPPCRRTHTQHCLRCRCG